MALKKISINAMGRRAAGLELSTDSKTGEKVLVNFLESPDSLKPDLLEIERWARDGKAWIRVDYKKVKI